MEQKHSREFTRHRGPVTCVAGIPDNHHVITSGYDGAVGWFDLETGEVQLLGYHRHLVNRVTVNSAGTRAATSSSDYTVYLWDLQTLRLERILRGHSDDVEDFVFVSDTIGASVSRDWRTLIWDLEHGNILDVLEGHEKDALAVNYHDGRLYTSGDDMTLRVWDIGTGQLLKTWGPFDTETDTCAIDPIHGRAVLGCDDGLIRVFDIHTGANLAEIPAHRSGIKKVAVSPTTGDILSAAYDQKIHLWDAGSLERRGSLEGKPALWERSFNWSPDGSRIFSGTFDGTVVVWDSRSGRCLAEIGDQQAVQGNACFNEVSAGDNGEIALVSDDGFVRLARLTPEESGWLARVEPGSGRVLMNAVTMDQALDLVVCGTHHHRIQIYERANGGLKQKTETYLGQGPINSIRVSHHPGFEGISFVGCYSGAIVRVTPDGQIDEMFRVHENAVKALRLHPRHGLGVSCSADGVLASWELSGKLIRRFVGHMGIIDDVDIDPTGRCIASAGRDFTLKVYSLDDGQLRHSVSLGRRSPKAICFFDPATVVVTNYWGELLKVTLPDERVYCRSIARNGISSIARSGEHVIVTSYDGAVYLVRPADLAVIGSLRAMTQRLDGGSDE